MLNILKYAGRAVLVAFLLVPLNTSSVFSSQVDFCRVFGAVYLESSPQYADYRVFVEDSEAFCDVVVFKADNRLFADRPGLWFFTETKAFADFSICFEKERGLADFTVYFTDTESFAGCNR